MDRQKEQARKRRLHAEMVNQASFGDTEGIRRSLEAGANINIRHGNRKMTVLHVASVMGHGDAVRFLLANGSRLDITDAAGNTPLQAAEAMARDEVVEILKSFVRESQMRTLDAPAPSRHRPRGL